MHMAAIEHLDVWVGLVVLILSFIVMKFKPSVEDVHSIVEMANTKGGIIVILFGMSMIFFVSGLRFMYWTVSMQLSHPNDTVTAWMTAGFNWISGGAFAGAFGAMIATMKGESLPPSPTNGKGTTSTTVTSTVSTSAVPVVPPVVDPVVTPPVVPAPVPNVNGVVPPPPPAPKV